MSGSFPSHQIPPSSNFSREALGEADSLTLTPEVLAARRKLQVDSVDAPLNRIREQAFDVDANGTLGISVIDPTVIDSHGPLAREIISRGRSQFIGTRLVPLLPSQLSKGQLSLLATPELIRPAVTVFTDQKRKESPFENGKLELTSVSVRKELAPADLQTFIHDAAHPLYAIAGRLIGVSRRMKSAGTMFLESSGLGVQHEETLQRSSLRFLIARSRLLFDGVAMLVAEKLRVPLIYTNQTFYPQSPGQVEMLRRYQINPEDREAARALAGRRLASDTENEYSITPTGHFGLNRDRYASFSTPLSEAVSFLNISNLVAALRRRPLPYPQAELADLAEYLTEGERLREKDLEKRSRIRVAKIADDDLNSDLHALSSADFRLVLEEAASVSPTPQGVVAETVRRLETKEMGSLLDMAYVGGAPECGDLSWKPVNDQFLKWLDRNQDRGLELLELAQRHLSAWESFEWRVIEMEEGWQTWVTANIDGSALTLPHRLAVQSGQSARKHAALEFWRGLAQGTLIDRTEPPEDNVVTLPYLCPIPKDIELPASPPQILDPLAADKLHVICGAAGFNRPRIEKEQARIKGGTEHRVVISGIQEIPPSEGVVRFKKSGQATNLAAGVAQASIRQIFGIEKIGRAAIMAQRHQSWRAFLELGRSGSNQYRKPEISLTPFRTVQSLCRSHEWRYPHFRRGKDGKTEVSLACPLGIFRAVADSRLGSPNDLDAAGAEILKQISRKFVPSSDRTALTDDRSDPNTPLGALLRAARRLRLPEPQFTWDNDGPKISVKGTLQLHGEKAEEWSDEYWSERPAVNDAAQALLYAIKNQVPGESELGIPSVPSASTEHRTLPVGVLSRTDPVQELRLLCAEEGHEAPKYRAEIGIGESGKPSRYTCSVKTRQGDTIVKVEVNESSRAALNNAAAYMLQHLRPEYQGAGLYQRKLQLLVGDHGYRIGGPYFTRKPSELRPGIIYDECIIDVAFGPTQFSGVSLRTSREEAHEAACHSVLRKIYGRQRARYDKKFGVHARD